MKKSKMLKEAKFDDEMANMEVGDYYAKLHARNEEKNTLDKCVESYSRLRPQYKQKLMKQLFDEYSDWSTEALLKLTKTWKLSNFLRNIKDEDWVKDYYDGLLDLPTVATKLIKTLELLEKEILKSQNSNETSQNPDEHK